jgi:hypothetical protein
MKMNRLTVCRSLRWAKKTFIAKDIFGFCLPGEKPIHKNEIEKLYDWDLKKERKQITTKEAQSKPVVNNKKFYDHFNRKKVLYICNLYKPNKKILLMIDIDIQKSKKIGTKEGAITFANHLKTIFPNLYTEPSTSGNAIHGYIWISTKQRDYKETKKAISIIEDYLIAEAHKVKADIEQVEVKGNPALRYKKDRQGNIARADFGQLYKCPYAYANQEDATKLDNSATLDIDYVLDKWDFERFTPPATNNKRQGSNNTMFAPPSDFVGRMKQYVPKLQKLFGDAVCFKDGTRQRKITPVMWSIFICIAETIKNDPENSINTSVDRFQAIWKSLRNQDIIPVGFHRKTFCVMKKLLSERGFIRWVRWKHSFEDKRKGEEKGYANEFYISEELTSQLNSDFDCEETGAETHRTPICWDMAKDQPRFVSGEFKQVNPPALPVDKEVDYGWEDYHPKPKKKLDSKPKKSYNVDRDASYDPEVLKKIYSELQ